MDFGGQIEGQQEQNMSFYSNSLTQTQNLLVGCTHLNINPIFLSSSCRSNSQEILLNYAEMI